MRSGWVKIGKNKWRIQFVDTVSDYDMGECDYDKRKLYIRKGQSVRDESNTVLHEIMHALCHDRKLGLKGEEENVVNNLTNGLQAFLRDNPGFGRKLMEALGEG